MVIPHIVRVVIQLDGNTPGVCSPALPGPTWKNGHFPATRSGLGSRQEEEEGGY